MYSWKNQENHNKKYPDKLKLLSPNYMLATKSYETIKSVGSLKNIHMAPVLNRTMKCQLYRLCSFVECKH